MLFVRGIFIVNMVYY